MARPSPPEQAEPVACTVGRAGVSRGCRPIRASRGQAPTGQRLGRPRRRGRPPYRLIGVAAGTVLRISGGHALRAWRDRGSSRALESSARRALLMAAATNTSCERRGHCVSVCGMASVGSPPRNRGYCAAPLRGQGAPSPGSALRDARNADVHRKRGSLRRAGDLVPDVTHRVGIHVHSPVGAPCHHGGTRLRLARSCRVARACSVRWTACTRSAVCRSLSQPDACADLSRRGGMHLRAPSPFAVCCGNSARSRLDAAQRDRTGSACRHALAAAAVAVPRHGHRRLQWS
jgi:hypothetical protein